MSEDEELEKHINNLSVQTQHKIQQLTALIEKEKKRTQQILDDQQDDLEHIDLDDDLEVPYLTNTEDNPFKTNDNVVEIDKELNKLKMSDANQKQVEGILEKIRLKTKTPNT